MEKAFVSIGARIAAASTSSRRRSRFDEIFKRHRQRRLEWVTMAVIAAVVSIAMFAV